MLIYVLYVNKLSKNKHLKCKKTVFYLALIILALMGL